MTKQKVIFSTSLTAAGTGIICTVEGDKFTDPVFVAVNTTAGSDTYAYYIDGSATSNGRSNPEANLVWEELAEYLGAERILPVGQPQIKKWFKEVYKEKLAEFKYNLSDEKRAATEANKLKNKTQSGGLWLRSHGGKGYWN